MSDRLISIDDGHPNQPKDWVRLEANATVAQCHAAQNSGAGIIIPVAVSPEGRRLPDALQFDSYLDLAKLVSTTTPVIPIFEHAGPCAGTWSAERPVGASEVPDVPTGRTPRPATEQDWVRIQSEMEKHLGRLPASSPAVVSLDDDGLLMAALSPRTNPTVGDVERLQLLKRFVEPLIKIRPDVGVTVCIDELAPRGIDLAFGLEQVKTLAQLGVRWTIWSSGTRALSSLKRRPREQTQAHVWSSPARLVADRSPRTPGDRRWLVTPHRTQLQSDDDRHALSQFDAFVVDGGMRPDA